MNLSWLPLTGSILVALILSLVLGGGVWLAVERRTAARRREADVARLLDELRRPLPDGLAPTEQNVAEVTGEVVRMGTALERWRRAIAGRPPAIGTAPVPRDRSEAFFDLEAFRGRMRNRAAELGIAIRAGEQFGFSAYLHEGPEEALIPAVFRQREVIEFLLTTLFQHPPVELQVVQREHPVPPGGAAAASGRPGGRAGPAGSPDLFEIDPRITTRVNGLVGATAFRVVFVGQTATLRSFLAGVGGYDLPLIVRGVEVEPPLSGGRRPDGSPAGGAEIPGLSQFTVVIEQIELLAESPVLAAELVEADL